METGYKVCDAMTEKPVTIGPNATLKQCAELMAKKHVGGVLVEEDGKLVGILTDKDIVRKAVAKGIPPGKKKAKDIMETKLITISPEKDIFEAITKMRDMDVRHLPVMDKGKFLGLITMKDILKIEPDLFDLMVEKFELKEEERKPVYRVSEKEGVCELCGEYSEELTYEDEAQLCPNCKEEL